MNLWDGFTQTRGHASLGDTRKDSIVSFLYKTGEIVVLNEVMEIQKKCVMCIFRSIHTKFNQHVFLWKWYFSLDFISSRGEASVGWHEAHIPPSLRYTGCLVLPAAHTLFFFLLKSRVQNAPGETAACTPSWRFQNSDKSMCHGANQIKLN